VSAIVLDGASLDCETLARIGSDELPVALDPVALDRVARNRAALEAAISRGDTIYGVTTGLGALVRERLSFEQAVGAQRDVLRSHAAGVGDPLSRELVRAALAARLNGLLRGYSGIRPVVLERVAEILNAGLVPTVPRTGSLGASGDLAPSAHAFLPLVGEGELAGLDGVARVAADALAEAGIQTIELAPKEALALVNGTHFMAAAGALAAPPCRSRRFAARPRRSTSECMRSDPLPDRLEQRRSCARSSKDPSVSAPASSMSRTPTLSDAFRRCTAPPVRGSPSSSAWSTPI
jgi:histidine ammonia-lyase